VRWFTHLTALRRDEGVARLISRYGFEAYGHLQAVMEEVAGRMDATSHCSVTYPVSEWSRILSVRGSHMRHRLSKLRVTGWVTVSWKGSEATVTIPKLLKWRDEYTRKSRQTPESVGPLSQSQSQSQTTGLTDGLTDKPPGANSNGANGQADLGDFLKAIGIDRVMEEPANEDGTAIVANLWNERGRPKYLPDLIAVIDQGLSDAKGKNILTPKILWKRLRDLRRTFKAMSPDQQTQHYHASRR
jgi:hypothetical protein